MQTPLNRVLFISLYGERTVFKDVDLQACIRKANELNSARGFHAGVHVVEDTDGYRMTAADCKAAALTT